jgi:hypothetical protein
LDIDSNNNLYNDKSGGHDTTYQVNPIVLTKFFLESLHIVVAFAENQKDGVVMPLLIEESLLLLLFFCGVSQQV